MSQTCEVTGALVTPDGQPLTGTRVFAVPVRQAPVAFTGDTLVAPVSVETKSDSAGAWVLRLMRGARYTLVVEGVIQREVQVPQASNATMRELINA